MPSYHCTVRSGESARCWHWPALYKESNPQKLHTWNGLQQGKRVCHVDSQRRVWWPDAGICMTWWNQVALCCINASLLQTGPREISTGSHYSEQLISNAVPGFYLFLSQILTSTLFHNWLLKSQFSPDSNLEPCRPTTHMPQLTRRVMPQNERGRASLTGLPFPCKESGWTFNSMII